MRRETSRYGTLYEEYRQALEENGVHYLSDQRAFIGGDTAVYGLDLPDEVYRPGGGTLPEGYIQAVLGKADPGRFSILLAHSPCFFPQYADWGADLTLSGHFHGGHHPAPGSWRRYDAPISVLLSVVRRLFPGF